VGPLIDGHYGRNDQHRMNRLGDPGYAGIRSGGKGTSTK